MFRFREPKSIPPYKMETVEEFLARGGQIQRPTWKNSVYAVKFDLHSQRLANFTAADRMTKFIRSRKKQKAG